MGENWMRPGFRYNHPRLCQPWRVPTLRYDEEQGVLVEDISPAAGKAPTHFGPDEVFSYFVESFPRALAPKNRDMGGIRYAYLQTKQFLINYVGQRYEHGELDALEILLYGMDAAKKTSECMGTEIVKPLDIDEQYLKAGLIARDLKATAVAEMGSVWE